MPLPTRWRNHPAAAALLIVGLALIAFDAWRWWRWHRRHADRGYAPAGFSSPSDGYAHLSAYVFRDRDRDGRYDGRDLPMAGVIVEVESSSGRKTRERSNLTGFANFDMSRARWRAPMHRPGTYVYRAEPPPGWTLTSGNREQRTHIEELIGAPADLVSIDPPRPFGFAPELAIAGRVLARQPDGSLDGVGGVRLAVAGAAGETMSAAADADGAFRIAAGPGAWTLSISGPGGAELQRRVEVDDVPVAIVGLVLGEEPVVSAATPQTLDFESITGSMVRKIPSGFAGLDWNYLNAIEAVWANGDGYANTLVSGHYVAYSSSGHPVTISRQGGFDWVGGYFGIAHRAPEGDKLSVRAYRGSTLVAEDDVVLSSLGSVWIDAHLGGVDRVELATHHYWQFAVDDLVVAVPETSATASSADRAGSPASLASAPPKP